MGRLRTVQADNRHGFRQDSCTGGDRIHFWPFDGWDPPAGRSVIAEIYPALFSREFARKGLTADQHDAYSIAGWMRRVDIDGSLAAFFNPHLTPVERMVSQVEGWILGVE